MPFTTSQARCMTFAISPELGPVWHLRYVYENHGSFRVVDMEIATPTGTLSRHLCDVAGTVDDHRARGAFLDGFVGLDFPALGDVPGGQSRKALRL
jgi:hypothetical protein